VTLWTILSFPALLAMLCFVVEATNLWHSRVQLENALEAAALAAVQYWGEAGGGPTLDARRVGVAYASYNAINGVPVTIDLNYDPGGDVNENDDACDGDLIFGAVTADDVEDEWLFDTDTAPTCGRGRVLIDATGQGNLDSGTNNEWGVAFLNDEDTPANLRICSVTITLPPTVGNQRYYFESNTLAFSDNSNNIFDNDNIVGCDQNDVVGLDTGQIGTQFAVLAPCQSSPGTAFYKRVTFTFPLDGSVNEFAPCDRFRFGMNVEDLNLQSCQGNQVDGDDIGDVGTTVTIVFAESGDGNCNNPDPGDIVTTSFVNLTWPGRTCFGVYDRCSGFADPADNSHILVPPGIPNLPNGAIPNNQRRDGQSYALSAGPGAEAFGVRAQATVAVPSLCVGFCGLNLPFEVSAKATAMYDCTEEEPRLIRVLPENFRGGVCIP
jgi:hypothetical protein